MIHRYCAFLRGVNVKGTNMKMADVRSVFEKAGMGEVSTVLASGNILFSAGQNAPELKNVLEAAMSGHFNYEAYLFLKDKNEVQDLVNHNPYESDPNFHIYGFVGRYGIEDTLMEAFENSEKIIGEEAQILSGNFYWKIPKGNTLASEFSKILGRKTLKNAFTSRNMNTIEKVLKKM